MRFEGPGIVGGTHRARPPARGPHHRARRQRASLPRHLNKHIDYDVVPEPAGREGRQPRDAARHGGHQRRRRRSTSPPSAPSKVGVFDTAQLESRHLRAERRRPHRGQRRRAERPGARRGATAASTSLTRFDNAISVVDTTTRDRDRPPAAVQPRAASVVDGPAVPLRRALHLEQRRGVVLELPHLRRLRQPGLGPRQPRRHRRSNNPNPFRVRPVGCRPDFHPMKGPMTTQTLRGMANHGPMHWRGDRTGGNDPGGDAARRDRGVPKFSVAFAGLLGRDGPIPDRRHAGVHRLRPAGHAIRPTRSATSTTRSTADQQAGRDFFIGPVTDTVPAPATAATSLDPAHGLLRHRRLSSFEDETQIVQDRPPAQPVPEGRHVRHAGGRRSSTPATTASRATRSAASASSTTAASTPSSASSRAQRVFNARRRHRSADRSSVPARLRPRPGADRRPADHADQQPTAPRSARASTC